MRKVRPIDGNELEEMLIHQSEAVEAWKEFYKGVIWTVKKKKTLDYAPVRHGKWVKEGERIWCNVCHALPMYDHLGKIKLSDWCHTCGAKMDGGKKDGNGGLKICPFCGGKAYICKEAVPNKPTLYAVDCSNDDCQVDPSTGYYEDLLLAIEAWNRRAKDDD